MYIHQTSIPRWYFASFIALELIKEGSSFLVRTIFRAQQSHSSIDVTIEGRFSILCSSSVFTSPCKSSLRNSSCLNLGSNADARTEWFKWPSSLYIGYHLDFKLTNCVTISFRDLYKLYKTKQNRDNTGATTLN